jgi:RNA polymerase sigma-70 factor, ECF subfamily
MPPILTWFAGREPITQFLQTRVLRRPGDFKMLAVAANGQPGFAGYLRAPDGTYHAHAVQVLTLRAEGIAHVISFNQPELFTVFGIPPTLPTATGLAGPPR